jgi:hypothetical protein
MTQYRMSLDVSLYKQNKKDPKYTLLTSLLHLVSATNCTLVSNLFSLVVISHPSKMLSLVTTLCHTITDVNIPTLLCQGYPKHFRASLRSAQFF